MNDRERIAIEQALARFLDGEPEPSDGEVLATALKDDPAFEREVVLMLMVDDLLRQHAVPHERAFVESLEMRLASEADDRAFLRRLRRRLDDEGAAVRPIRPWRRPVFWLAALAIALFWAVLLGSHWWGANPRRAPKSAPVPHAAEVDLVTTPGTTGLKEAVAVLTRVVDAHWNEADVSYDEGSALAPGRLRLASGLVQIEFISGASVIIEGPSDFELLSPYKAICRRGKLRAHVPPHARGFTIAAPGVNAIDLGTEFAMSVDEQGRGQVHVVEGEVELQAVGGPAAAAAQSLKAGRGADFGRDGVFREIAADPTDFVDYSRLVRLEDAHHRRRQELWLAHSRALRADPATVVYYSFEVGNTWERTLRNVAARGDSSLDGSIVGCLWCPGRWPGKTALEFKRTSDRVRINVPGRFDQLSMAAWVRIEGLNHWYSSLMLTDDFDPGEAHWQLTASGQIVLGVAAADEGQRNVDYDSRPLLGPSYLGQWVHIATVYDKPRNRVSHYLNGTCVFERRLQYPITLRIGAATIGNWNWNPTAMPAMPDSSTIRSLNGRIDEFVILCRVLTGAEIKEMYEEGKPSS